MRLCQHLDQLLKLKFGGSRRIIKNGKCNINWELLIFLHVLDLIFPSDGKQWDSELSQYMQ